jgi:dihydroneopterin triphosphate diphosphatase
LAEIVSRIVEICVFRMIRNKPQFLILQRSSDEVLYPDLWQIVTGTVDKNESAFHAALRELKEETGLKIKRCWTVPFVDSYFDTAADTVQLAPVFAVEVEGTDDVKLSLEHQAFHWVSLKDAQKKLVWPGQCKALEMVREFIVGGKEAGGLSEIPQP